MVKTHTSFLSTLLTFGLFFSFTALASNQNSECTQDPTDTRTSSQCYWLGLEEKFENKDRLCIMTDFINKTHSVTLRTGYPNERVVSTFEFERNHAFLKGFNRDQYRVPEKDSALQALSIEFDGVIDPQTFAEKGRVRIGNQFFFYRSY